jgi:hypothetical protein
MVASAALVENNEIAVRVPEERRIAWTTAASIAFHVILLTAIGLSAIPSIDLSSLPDMSFDVSLEDGHDDVNDNSPATERSFAESKPLSEDTPAAVADDAPPHEEPPPPVVASASPAPAPNEATDPQPVQTEVSVPSEPAPATENTEVLATSGQTDLTVPVLTELEPVKATPLEEELIPTSQRALLTKKIMEGAQGFQDTDKKETRMSWQQDGKVYTAVLTRQPAADNTGIDRMVVEVVTEERGKRLRTRMLMKRLAFSHFTQLVDRWDEEVQLHDDEIVGRFHSNSEIFLGYDRKVAPKFLGKVTTAARSFTVASAIGRKERAEIFRAGLETRAGRITLPTKFMPFASDSNSGTKNVEVQSYASDTRITFYSDGTYGWAPARGNSPEQRQALSAATTYIVGGRDTTLYIRGTVAGKVLVYSPDLIVIEGHLVYAHDPRSVPDSSDFLGLVSDNYVEVARPGITGPGDLEIDAAIYAKRRFVVTDERAPGNATLYIYGSLTAGTLSATEPRYATKVSFDSRFEDQRPPGFPVTDRYEIEGWDPQWKISDDDAASDTEPDTDTNTATSASADQASSSG